MMTSLTGTIRFLSVGPATKELYNKTSLLETFSQWQNTLETCGWKNCPCPGRTACIGRRPTMHRRSEKRRKSEVATPVRPWRHTSMPFASWWSGTRVDSVFAWQTDNALDTISETCRPFKEWRMYNTMRQIVIGCIWRTTSTRQFGNGNYARETLQDKI